MGVPQRYVVASLQLLTLLNHYESTIATAILGPTGTAVNIVDPSDKKYNFLVAIESRDDKNVICTGSLISKRHVLTASHCMDEDEDAKDLRVILGSYSRHSADKRTLEIAEVTSFLQWVRENGVRGAFNGPQDIAVYTLSKDVADVDVRYMPLTDKPKEHFYGKIATIVGWGETEDEYESVELRVASLRILTPKQCEAHARRHFFNDPNATLRLIVPESFCSYSGLSVQLGEGDSGGPLIYEDEIVAVAEGTYPTVIRGEDEDADHPRKLNFHAILEQPHRDFVRSFRKSCR